MAVEVFSSNQYVASCDVTESYVRVWCPIKETNNLDGWQQYKAPSGYDIDSNGVKLEGWVYCPNGTLENIKVDRFPEDDTNNYYMITAPEGATNDNGDIFESGSKFYKVSFVGNIEEYKKNRS